MRMEFVLLCVATITPRENRRRKILWKVIWESAEILKMNDAEEWKMNGDWTRLCVS
jgi:hypothetical protein